MDNMVKKVHDLLLDKKALDVLTLSIRKISPIADYFVIATGTSSTHIVALCDHLEKELAKEKIFAKHKEGKQKGEWVLIDFEEVVVHIFNRELRDYYSLERIWNDAERIDL